jgi:hypothetical protein
VRQRRRRRRSREKIIDEATARAEQCTNGESSTAMDAARIELQRVGAHEWPRGHRCRAGTDSRGEGDTCA